MNTNILRIFRIFRMDDEMETPNTIIDRVREGLDFSGTNVWILMMAIMIACLGLNVNSTAVVIGAMLISPLMGPIVGLGFAAGINDLKLLRRSLKNYAVMTIVSLLVSSVYFFISPIDQAYSEILARTTPTLYDVMIALVGGTAGVIALFSTKKGNVVPGVAIATALMPPLCTAGFGLANGNGKYFFGALFLYFINSVYIGLANYVFTKFYLSQTHHQVLEEKVKKRLNYIITAIVLLTVIPSVVFAYRMVKNEKFNTMATTFINKEVNTSDYLLLSKNIDPSNKEIDLTFGGISIDSSYIKGLQERLNKYYDPSAKLVISQGFSLEKVKDEQSAILADNNSILNDKISYLQSQVDSLQGVKAKETDIKNELKALDPKIEDIYVEEVPTDSNMLYKVFVESENRSPSYDMKKFLQEKLNTTNIELYYVH